MIRNEYSRVSAPLSSDRQQIATHGNSKMSLVTLTDNNILNQNPKNSI